MQNKITGKSIAKNITLSITAQIISLIISLILGFIVPKCIDEYQYSYWQTYVLYAGYVGILHFGILDGLILRYSQYDYDELDKKRIRSQYYIIFILTLLMSGIGVIFSLSLLSETNKIIFVIVSLSIVVKNVFGYTSYMLQMTNRINKYALTIIIQRSSYAIMIILLLVFKVNDFYWYCIADLLGDLIGIAFGGHYSLSLYFGKPISFKENFNEVWINLSAGVFLTIANFSSNFLIGGAKMVIQWHWDTLVFGKVSFAFSVTNLFLTFVTAISVVLFPSLKRMKEEELPALYGQIRNAISPLLFLALLLYFPMCWILEKWLPSYAQSLVYLGVLLPIIIFSSKVNLLTNNYLKAYRKEKIMLVINLLSVALGFGLSLFFAYVVENLDLLLFSVVFVVILRSILSEIVVGKIIKRKGIFDYIVELIMTVIFIAAARYLSILLGCFAYAVALIIYFILYRKSLISMAHIIKDGIQKRKLKNVTNEETNKSEIGEEDK